MMMDYVKSQSGHPRGLLGHVIGWILAAENRERIAWAVGQMGIEPTDHLLEIGYGPGLAIASAAIRVPAGVDVSEVMLEQAAAELASF